MGAVINGKAPESILDTWATQRRMKWLTFTNQFSIENKRLIQMGGYSDDPLGIWKKDEISKEHDMDEFLSVATPDKKEADLQFLNRLKDKKAQYEARVKQWDITMDPLWMAPYEDPEVIKYRMSLRPKQNL